MEAVPEKDEKNRAKPDEKQPWDRAGDPFEES